MTQEKILSATRQIKFITNVSIGVNLLLSVIKVVTGIFGHSMALVADGIHSLSDMVTDIVVLVGVHFGTKEADPKHPYGHGRFETFATALISVGIIAVGFGMIYSASANISKSHTPPSPLVLAAAAVSIVVKEWLYRITKRYAIKTHSSVLYANAWEHRSDALSSVVVFIGIGAMMLGFRYGDHLAAIAVGLMISLVGFRILGDCMQEFTESAVDDKTIENIINIIKAESGIRQWHKLRTRRVGREVFLDFHILVDPKLDVTQAHKITEDLEGSLHTQMAIPVNITVHIEPDLPELRR